MKPKIKPATRKNITVTVATWERLTRHMLPAESRGAALNRILQEREDRKK